MRHHRPQVDRKCQPLCLRLRPQQFDHRIGDLRRVAVFRINHGLAGFQFGEVQNVVEQHQQPFRRPPSRCGPLSLGRCDVVTLEQRKHAQHAVHRRSDLMTDGREELAFHAVGMFGDLARMVLHVRLPGDQQCQCQQHRRRRTGATDIKPPQRHGFGHEVGLVEAGHHDQRIARHAAEAQQPTDAIDRAGARANPCGEVIALRNSPVSDMSRPILLSSSADRARRKPSRP